MNSPHFLCSQANILYQLHSGANPNVLPPPNMHVSQTHLVVDGWVITTRTVGTFHTDVTLTPYIPNQHGQGGGQQGQGQGGGQQGQGGGQQGQDQGGPQGNGNGKRTLYLIPMILIIC
jgi:hypothetical protein